MDAIAGQWLAIGLELCKLAFIPVVLLSLLGLLGGRGVELGVKIPSFSLKLRVWPREIPEMPTPPFWEGRSDDHESRKRERTQEFLKDLNNQQQVDSREI